MRPEIVAVIAAFATTASAIVIAWQAFLTRSAVKVSRNALVLSERTYTRDLIATIESRSRVPRIEPGMLVSTLAIRSDNGVEKVATASDVFRFPRDQNLSALVRLPLVIANDGGRSMTVSAKWPAQFETLAVTTPWVRIPEGGTIGTMLVIQKPLVALRGGPTKPTIWDNPGTFVGTVQYDGPLDADMSSYHHVFVTIASLVENSEMTGDWSFAETPDVFAMIWTGGARTYWESRSEGIKIREDEGVSAEVALRGFLDEFERE